MKSDSPNDKITDDTYLQIYRRNEKGIKVLIIVSLLVLLAGIAGLISNLFLDKSTFPGLTLWNSLLFIFLGILYVILMRKSLRDKKYHISWNDKAVQFQLPKQKEVERIDLDDIDAVTVSDQEIKMKLKNDQEKKINLNFIFLPQRDMVKEFFETMDRAR